MIELEVQLARARGRPRRIARILSIRSSARRAGPATVQPTCSARRCGARVRARLVVGGGFTLFGGSGDSPSVHTSAVSTGVTNPAATVQTTNPLPVCQPLDGADGSAKEGDAIRWYAGDRVALLLNVQSQASDCIDGVSFLFGNGASAWSLTYEPGASRYLITFRGPVSDSVYRGIADLRPGPPGARCARSSDCPTSTARCSRAIALDAEHRSAW